VAVPDEATVTVLDIKTACNILCGGASVDPNACRGANALRDILLATAKMRPEIVKKEPEIRTDAVRIRPAPRRWKLPDNRESRVHKFQIDETEGYITVGLYPDGLPGEIFLKLHKVGSLEHGMADCFALLFSLALQCGIPLETLVSKFKHVKFQPSGVTKSQAGDLRFADSIVDYIVRWLEMKFIK
jgi:ribonucleoside-diphosphate reductase alpha chain